MCVTPLILLKNIFGIMAILLIFPMVFFVEKFNGSLLITVQLFAAMSYLGLGTLENIRKGIIKISFGADTYSRKTQPKQFWFAIGAKSLLWVLAAAMFLFFLFFYTKPILTG